MNAKEAWLKSMEFCGFAELAERFRKSPAVQPLGMSNHAPPLTDEIVAEMRACEPKITPRKSTGEKINDMALAKWGM